MLQKRLYPALVASLLIAAAAGLSACGNTAHGFGQDMERAGEKIQQKTN